MERFPIANFCIIGLNSISSSRNTPFHHQARCPTNILLIDDIEIDTEALFSISHRCAPGTCEKKQCCCSKYEIVIERDEIDRVIGYMPAAAKYAPRIGSADSPDNIFEEDDDGAFIVDTDDDGLCAFAYTDCRRNILCSLHSVALDLKIPHYRTKPMSCVLWPLAISEDLPLRISIAEDAFSFPCNIERNNPGRLLDPNIARIIQDVFGIKVLTGINQANR